MSCHVYPSLGRKLSEGDWYIETIDNGYILKFNSVAQKKLPLSNPWDQLSGAFLKAVMLFQKNARGETDEQWKESYQDNDMEKITKILEDARKNPESNTVYVYEPHGIVFIDSDGLLQAFEAARKARENINTILAAGNTIYWDMREAMESLRPHNKE